MTSEVLSEETSMTEADSALFQAIESKDLGGVQRALAKGANLLQQDAEG